MGAARYLRGARSTNTRDLAAYLKRALRAISTAVEAATQMSHDGSLKIRQFEELYERLFQVRDSIIVMMGDLRAEWRRRYGS